jgi:hypothetical protein
MNNIKTYNEYQLINEGVSDFFNKNRDIIKSIINGKLDRLSTKQIYELRKALYQYKDLSIKEIQEKIKDKINVNENMEEDIDPYGEEIWGEEGNRIDRINFIRRSIWKILGKTAIVSGGLIPATLVLNGIIKTILGDLYSVTFVKYFVGIDAVIFLLTTIIFFTCNKLWRNRM